MVAEKKLIKTSAEKTSDLPQGSKIFPKFDEKKSEDGLKYLKYGIEIIQKEANTGFLTAFPSKNLNSQGFPILREQFKTILNEYDIEFFIQEIPDFFDLFIKFSPISQFKKWIFIISNHNYLAVSERNKEIKLEFFLMILKDRYIFQPISKNIAHERFLFYLFDREKIPQTTFTFSTFFDERKRIILYKDYEKRKVSSVKVIQNLMVNKLYNVKITLIKDSKSIRLKCQVQNGKVINHSIKFGYDKTTEKNSLLKTTRNFKSIEEYREDVLLLIKKIKNKNSSTNKFANISLGRINKIPLLVNLPSKYKNTDVILNFNKKEKLEIFDKKKGSLLKSFHISTNPSSNWLVTK